MLFFSRLTKIGTRELTWLKPARACLVGQMDHGLNFIKLQKLRINLHRSLSFVNLFSFSKLEVIERPSELRMPLDSPMMSMSCCVLSLIYLLRTLHTFL